MPYMYMIQYWLENPHKIYFLSSFVRFFLPKNIVASVLASASLISGALHRSDEVRMTKGKGSVHYNYAHFDKHY